MQGGPGSSSTRVSGDVLRWDDVRLFLALCRVQTLGDAARVLELDTSTVSRRLTALETSMGASLFERGRGGITATSAAEGLLPVAEEIEGAMTRFSGAAEALEREVRGMVRIACPPDMAEVLIVPRLPTLLERHPGLQLDLQAGEGVVEVSRRAADIAVRTVRPESGDLIIRGLPAVEWVLAASPERAAVLGSVRRWEDVPFVTFGERFGQIPAARWTLAHGVPVLRSDSLRVQISVVAEGIGVALLPKGSVAHYGLEPVKLSAKLRKSMSPWPADPLCLVTHRALRRVPRVDAVWAFLLEEISAFLGGPAKSGKKRRSAGASP